jgi:ERCC4-related helicase
VGQFTGTGNTIKQLCIDWMVKNTADAATALFVAHVAKKVSRYIYGQVNKYLKELKEKNSDERVETSDKDIVTNPRCKKKKEIRYEESLRQVLKNTRFSELYTMLLDIYQLTYLQQESTLADQEKNKVPIHNWHVPFFLWQ